jgi:two-component system cell cycle sensor histidine kinase/response regulator CckA
MDTNPQKTVLLVDDDDGVLAILEHTMSRMLGWRVLTAENGEHALAKWRDHINTIDLLITDLHMPEMNGCVLAERIRQLHPKVPIIFVSGDSGSELATSVEAVSNHRYLKKPFRTSELSALVANVAP